MQKSSLALSALVTCSLFQSKLSVSFDTALETKSGTILFCFLDKCQTKSFRMNRLIYYYQYRNFAPPDNYCSVLFDNLIFNYYFHFSATSIDRHVGEFFAKRIKRTSEEDSGFIWENGKQVGANVWARGFYPETKETVKSKVGTLLCVSIRFHNISYHASGIRDNKLQVTDCKRMLHFICQRKTSKFVL